jgi:hypothetical protein
MTVAELTAFLQSQPQDLQVAFRIYSEYCLLEANYIETKLLCTPRPDGWVHDARPDKPKQLYLILPGN